MHPEVHFAPAARREIRNLSRSVQAQVFEIAEKLRQDPRPPGVEKLANMPSFLRLPVGEDHCLVYNVRGPFLIIVLLIRGHPSSQPDAAEVNAQLAVAIREVAESERGLRLLVGR